ncbi:MAG: N-acetylmuramoyl-L-alanine amidase family protein [Bacillota bacterium]|nr:N-acetylmuramoyl-L-alanine amidase family protein [Bacillota bacterium]
MKKVVALVLVMVLLSVSLPAMAAGQQTLILHMDGKQITYKAPPVTIKLNGKEIKSDVPAVILDDRTLVPIRVISESTGARVDWNAGKYEVTVNTGEKVIKLKINSKEMAINGNTTSLEVPAKIINDRTMVPVRAVSEALGLKVGWVASTYTVLLDYPKADILDMYYDNTEGALVLKTTGKVMYQTMFLQEPDRLVIDFPNTVFRAQSKNVDVNSGNIVGVRASQFEVNPDVSRVVIDLASPSGYSITYDEAEKKLKIKMANAIKSIGFEEGGQRNKVVINSTARLEYNTIVLQMPDRIVVDLPNTYLEGTTGGTINIGKNGVKAVRYSQFEKNTVRVVIDLDAPLQYSVETSDSGLAVNLNGEPLKAIKYTETGWKTALLSINTGKSVRYNVICDKNTKSMLVEIPGDTAVLEEGEVFVNNGVVDRIQVVPYDSSRDASYVIVFLKDDLQYKVTSPEKTDNITIELSGVPVLYQDMLVVIDPGHGGQDPGATTKDGVQEKDLNLDVALRLKGILEGMGFRTLMTRQDDTFVDLYGRAEIANEANADLYMSVHFNAHTSTSIYGVEILYYPSSKNELDNRDNYTYAKIIQEELLKELKTVDRGLDPRDKLVVIRETKMPAVIAELGFLTNSSEKALITTEAYRQKCAQALANGIKRYVDEVLLKQAN